MHINDAMQLPTGDYQELEKISAVEKGLVSVGVDSAALTSSNSLYPVMVTSGLFSCIAIAIYCPDKHIAILAHNNSFMCNEMLPKILGKIKAIRPKNIEVHIVGGCVAAHDQDLKKYGSIEDQENKARGQYHELLSECLQQFETLKQAGINYDIKTFDTVDKARPTSVGIDARDGRLIRGTEILPHTALTGHGAQQNLENSCDTQIPNITIYADSCQTGSYFSFNGHHYRKGIISSSRTPN